MKYFKRYYIKINTLIFLASKECKCSCKDVMLTAIIGVLVFAILLLIIYIVWLHRKGKLYFNLSAVLSNNTI